MKPRPAPRRTLLARMGLAAATSAALTTTMPAAANDTPVDYGHVIPRFEEAARAELREWQIGGIATAWVDGSHTVYEAGFGEARKDSVFRCGSVSKLFNAVAVMQQVEEGRLDLDAPVETYTPGLVPVNPFPGTPPVSLRLLLSHRSGLQRESSTGGYLDPADPGILQSVQSLRGSVLVTPPGAVTRYSNIGPTLAGHALELVTGQDFLSYQTARVLGPLGMGRSAWRHARLPAGVACLPSRLRVADGRGGFPREETPLFDLGTIPAGNLFTTAGDLARFIAMLAADGDSPGGRVLRPGTLAQMFQPQGAEKGAFGLGFSPGEFHGRPSVGHGGAVYGHSTLLVFLPKEKLGVVVIANEDIVGGRMNRLASLALGLMLEARGEKLPVPTSATPAVKPPRAPLSAYAGGYESQSFWAELTADEQADLLRGNYASQPCLLLPLGEDRFLLRSRLHDDVPVEFTHDAAGRPQGFTAGIQSFTRVADTPPPAPQPWQALCGSYGPRFIPLVVFEKYGHLYASTENMVDYRLTPVTRHLFAMPPGMYTSEHVLFHIGPDGLPIAAELASMRLPRLPAR